MSLWPDQFNSTIPPITELTMFQFNEPYEETDPQTIREDMYELGSDDYDAVSVLLKLATYLPTDTLREFMDDYAMGRV